MGAKPDEEERVAAGDAQSKTNKDLTSTIIDEAVKLLSPAS